MSPAEETPLQRLTATQALRRIREGALTSEALTRACLTQIERLEPSLKAWAYLDPSLALAQARAVDEALRQGKDPGPLAGIPVGIKDIFNTQDMPTTMGSPIYAGYTPGNDARVVFNLRQAGAVLPGKTVTAEFAVHAPGPTVNPHHPDYSPGTSSSGSAAAVAAFMVPLALASQTAGSTIRPASYCGIYGYKPSFGLIPRTGSLKTTDSLDTIAFMARSVEDLELLLETTRVRGPDHPLVHRFMTDRSRHRRADRPWRVGWVRGPKWNDAEPYAQDALLRFSERLSTLPGVELHEAPWPPGLEEAHALHEIIYCRTLAYYFKEEALQEALVSPILKAMIAEGRGIGLEKYLGALQRQEELAGALDQWFLSGWDMLLTLSTGGEPLPGLAAPDRPDSCLIWTLGGVPAMSLPVFTGPHGLPFGAQVVCRRYNDLDLFRFVRALAQAGCLPPAPNPFPKGILSNPARVPHDAAAVPAN
ncbi:MAG: amidase [Candidatus Omnitrophica bacterium]|nr:amidase [Candidatus Omnitrophota bacterium]